MKGNLQFCIICGLPRQNTNEETGVTCGEKECLGEIGKRFYQIKEKIKGKRKIANSFGYAGTARTTVNEFSQIINGEKTDV